MVTGPGFSLFGVSYGISGPVTLQALTKVILKLPKNYFLWHHRINGK